MVVKLKEGVGEYLSTARFQANPNYELVLFDRLPDLEREAFAELQKQPGFYGILRPAESSGLSIKSVSQETALLYLSLREPGLLPAYVRAATGADYEATVARLVMDQILEIESIEHFVSGSAAYELFYGAARALSGLSRIGDLSVRALQYGQALEVADLTELSMRLYNYQRLPISARRREEFAGQEEIARLLGVDSNGRHSDLLSHRWWPAGNSSQRTRARGPGHQVNEETPMRDRTSPVSESKEGSANEEDYFTGWLSWNAPGTRDSQTNRATYKLYVSPQPDFIKEVFDISFQTLATTEAFHFKVGASVEGLMRPDKMVAYFSTLDELQTAAEVLNSRLEGCPAHGVPFTSELFGEGLISWGLDPPGSKRLLSWQPLESWRLWLTNRLANAILSAKNSPRRNGDTGLEPWQYAVERLRLEGVDTESWTPAPEIWQSN